MFDIKDLSGVYIPLRMKISRTSNELFSITVLSTQ